MGLGRNFEIIVYRLCILTGKTLKLALKQIPARLMDISQLF